MKLTASIRNYQFTNSLQASQHKTYREYEALAVLKFSFPELFSNLHKAEAPDLQDSDRHPETGERSADLHGCGHRPEGERKRERKPEMDLPPEGGAGWP